MQCLVYQHTWTVTVMSCLNYLFQTMRSTYGYWWAWIKRQGQTYLSDSLSISDSSWCIQPHSSYHHHIHFRALFSSTEGWAFLTSLSRRRPLHSERFWGSAESIPSFFLSFSSTSSHDFLGLPDLFCATTFSLRTSAIQPVLRSTCPNHLILLVRSTTSKSWMPSFVRRESELTLTVNIYTQACISKL